MKVDVKTCLVAKLIVWFSMIFLCQSCSDHRPLTRFVFVRKIIQSCLEQFLVRMPKAKEVPEKQRKQDFT
jgi:hypothetical protein